MAILKRGLAGEPVKVLQKKLGVPTDEAPTGGTAGGTGSGTRSIWDTIKSIFKG
jgi:hypothetical protein